MKKFLIIICLFILKISAYSQGDGDRDISSSKSENEINAESNLNDFEYGNKTIIKNKKNKQVDRINLINSEPTDEDDVLEKSIDTIRVDVSKEMPKIDLESIVKKNNTQSDSASSNSENKFRKRDKSKWRKKKSSSVPKSRNLVEDELPAGEEDYSQIKNQRGGVVGDSGYDGLFDNYVGINYQNKSEFIPIRGSGGGGKRNLLDIISDSAVVNFSDFGVGNFSNIFSVKGLANTPLFSNPSMIMYRDGAPVGDVFSYSGSYNEFDGVNVFSRSMGTYFGKNSYAGVLEFVSEPVDRSRFLRNEESLKYNKKHGGEIGFSIGSYNSFDLYGNYVINLKRDILWLNLYGSSKSGDGYLYNRYLDNNPDAFEESSFSGKLLFKPTEQLSFSIYGLYYDHDADASRFTSIDEENYTINSDINGNFEQRSNSQVFKANYHGDDFKISSVSSRVESKMDPFEFDLDQSPAPLSYSKVVQSQDYLSQEIRVDIDKSLRLSSFFGLFFAKNKLKSNTFRSFLSNIEETFYNQTEYEASFSSRFEYRLSNKWKLKLGGKILYFDKKFKRRKVFLTPDNNEVTIIPELNTVFPQGLPSEELIFELEDKYDNFSPFFEIEYSFYDNDYQKNNDEKDKQLILFTTLQSSYKPGGFSSFTDNIDYISFESESSNSIESGLKFKNIYGKFDGIFSLFYYDIKNYQIERAFNYSDYTILNARESSSYGFEYIGDFEVIKGLHFKMSIASSYTKLNDFFDKINGIDNSDKFAPYVPRLSYNLSLDYKSELGFFARVGYRGFQKIYYNDLNNDEFFQDKGGVLNAEIGFEKKSFNISFFGNNITGSHYYTYILPDVRGGTSVEPQSFGVKFSNRF